MLFIVIACCMLIGRPPRDKARCKLRVLGVAECRCRISASSGGPSQSSLHHGSSSECVQYIAGRRTLTLYRRCARTGDDHRQWTEIARRLWNLVQMHLYRVLSHDRLSRVKSDIAVSVVHLGSTLSSRKPKMKMRRR
jgi:hypothetical protein